VDLRYPHPIQMYGIPAIIKSRNVTIVSHPGKGSTLAYVMSIVHHLITFKEATANVSYFMVQAFNLKFDDRINSTDKQ